MINNILKKIEKANEVQNVKLAKHEINLAVADDLNKAKSEMQAIISQVNGELAKYKIADDAISKAKVEAQKIIDTASNNADKINAAGEKVIASSNKNLLKYGNLFDKIDKQARDLGIDPKSIPNYNEVDKLYFDVEAAIKALNGYTWQNA